MSSIVECPPDKRSFPTIISIVVAGFLIGMHILLPIGNSLPVIKFVGIPIHLPLIVYPLFAVVIFRLAFSNSLFRAGFLMLLLFSAIQFVSLFFSYKPIEGGYEAILNLFALAGTYSIVWMVIVNHDKDVIISLFTACLFLAALVGILEKINSQPIPPYFGWYNDWYAKIDSVSGYGEVKDGFRVWGTMGNPINFAALLFMGIPWVLSWKVKKINYIIICVMLVSAFLTLSRSIVFFAVPMLFYCVSIFILGERRQKLKYLIGTLSVIGLFWMFLGQQIITLWEARLVLESLNTNEGFAVREEIFKLAINTYIHRGNLILWLFGFGQGSGAVIASRVLYFMDTLDNAYLAILFQNGIIGLLVFSGFWLSLILKKGSRIMRSPHFWVICGYLASGLSFEMYHYFTLNFMAFGSYVWLMIYE